MPWRDAAERIANDHRADWRRALDALTAKWSLRGSFLGYGNCLSCNASALARSPLHPREVWNVSGGVERMDALSQHLLFDLRREGRKGKKGALPHLLAAPQQS